MIWKKVVLVLTFVLAIILVIITVNPASVPVTELRESVNLRLSSSAEIPFSKPFALNGLALSGAWEGSGFAEVWLVGEGRKYLVLDTGNLPKVLEFADFGTRFEAACVDSCDFPPLKPEGLFVLVSGPGLLSIDEFHLAVPISPSGLALCPNCKRIKASGTPNHLMLLIVLLSVIAVVGSHSLGHFCKNLLVKRILILLFLGGFVILGSMFGVSMAAPSAAIAVSTQKVASVFAAFGVVTLFFIGAVEMLAYHKQNPNPDVQKKFEEDDDE